VGNLRSGNYTISIPPLMCIVCPVIYEASWEHKKQHAAATSSGSPNFCIGIFAMNLSTLALDNLASIAEFMAPGATQLTVIPFLATSNAIALLIPITAILLAQ
jgi:hypothetical protein